MAAAAGVGAMLGLAAPVLVNAFGIAGSMAGGIIEYLADGSWTKRLHPGWAAQAGLNAALLARAGFTGPRTVFEGTHGLFNGFARTRDGDYTRLTGAFGRRWVAETVAFKPYACGTMTHPYIDCAIRLRARGIAAADIRSITCDVAEGTVHRLWEPLASKQAPPTPYAAKFSSPFCIAVGLLQQKAGFEQFTDATIRDRATLALAAKIRHEIDPGNPYPNAFTGHIRATLDDGSVIELEQPHMRGGVEEPMSDGELTRKFCENAVYGGWDRGRAEAFAARCVRVFETGPAIFRDSRS
jgi:2-methylcitrate dehydratase PrpD